MSLCCAHFDSNADMEKQRELFRLSFPEAVGSSIESQDHYLWKFHSFPATPSSFEYVATEQEILAGYYAALPYRYMIKGKELTAAMVCDVMTHPVMRGRGVFSKLGDYSTSELKKKGIHFTTGYPVRPEVIPGHLRVGWKIGFELPVYLGLLKSNSILKRKKLGFLAPLINFGLSLIHLVIDLFVKNDGQCTVQVIDFADFESVASDYEVFFKKWTESQNYYLIKDTQFLRWRLGAPSHQYLLVSLRRDQEIVAIAIARIADLKGFPCLAILDLMCLDPYLNSIGTLLRELKSIAIARGAEGVATMCSAHWAKKYRLSGSGIVKTPIIFKFITKLLNIDIDQDEFIRESNWHLMWIDCDDL